MTEPHERGLCDRCEGDLTGCPMNVCRSCLDELALDDKGLT